MKLIDKYLLFLTHENAYFNFNDDRYEIYAKLKSRLKKCNITKDNLPMSEIKMLKCRILALGNSIKNFEKSKNKCKYEKNPEKCENRYDSAQTSLRKKIDFYTERIKIVRRKNKLF